MQMTDAQLYCRKETIKTLCDAVFGLNRNPNDFKDTPIIGIYERTNKNEDEIDELKNLFCLNGNYMGLQRFQEEVVKPMIEVSVRTAIRDHISNTKHNSLNASLGEASEIIDEVFNHVQPLIYSQVSSEVHHQLANMISQGSLRLTFHDNNYY